MGKLLGNILLVAAAIAVNVIPGVGQVISGALGGVIAGAGVYATTAFSIASTLVSGLTLGLTALGLQSGLSLLGVGPSAPKPGTTETAIKNSRPPRVSAYGRSRLYGAYCLYETAPNGVAMDHYAIHEGAIDGIELRYLFDDRVTKSAEFINGGADGRYGANKVSWYETLGQVPGTANTWPAVSLAPGVWTANHRGDGIVAIGIYSASVKAEDFQDIYPQSMPPVPSIAARWQKCPDPAAVDPLNEAAWTWTENPVRHLLHYKLVREGPRPALAKSDPGYAAARAALWSAWWASKIAPTLQFWIDAAAVCDAPRPLKAGGTEAWYRSSVSHQHTDPHKGVVGNILATFDGWIAPRSDGALVVYAGKYYAPTVTIGPDEIVSYSWEGAGVDDDEAVNEILCTYISAPHDYTTPECDAWRDEDDITARGVVLSAPLDISCPSHAQVRYLAKRVMARKNARNRGKVTTNIAGRVVRGERFINIHLEEAGTVFYSGPAEVLAFTRNLHGGVTFEWVEADPNVDSWNPVTEEGEPAAKGNRIAPEPLDTPAISLLTAVVDGLTVRVQIDITAPDRTDLTWYAHARVSGASVWGPDEVFSDADPGAAVTIVSGPVPAGETMEFQVRYRQGDGRLSAWSATASIAVPSDVIYDGGTP